jgi:hypothetical protein
MRSFSFDCLEAKSSPTIILPLVGFDEVPAEVSDMPVIETPEEPEPVETFPSDLFEGFEPPPLPWWSGDMSILDISIQSYLNAQDEYEAANLPMHTFP